MVDYDGEYTLSFYRNKLRNGVCKGSFEGHNYDDRFIDGKFISGTVTLNTGAKIFYSKIFAPATYPNGQPGFVRDFNKLFVRPKKKLPMGYQNIPVIIDKTGKLKAQL